MNSNGVAHMEEVLRIADHAAERSDRWMMVFTLGILFALVIVVWRFLIADREKIANRLTAVTDRHIQTVEELSKVVANNTAALQEFRKTTEQCTLRNRA